MMHQTKAITVWIDETEVLQEGRRVWMIGQLITNANEEEYDFFKELRVKRKEARTWDALHANEFTNHNSRKWELLNLWLDVFLADPYAVFHVFVFEEDSWSAHFQSPHHYWAHQVCFGLGNKMKREGMHIQTVFKDVAMVTTIMDRKSTATGHISRVEGDTVTLERVNELEAVYEERIQNTLRSRSGKSSLGFHFSFANAKCFDALQLSDCLLYMARKQFLFEMGWELDAEEDPFLRLWQAKFLDENVRRLNDFRYDEKFNYFASSGANI